MTISLTQNVTAVSYSGATSVNATYGSALTSGSLLVAEVTKEDTAGSIAVADNGNAGGWAQDAFGQGAGGSAGIYSKQNTATTAATVTATLSGSTHGFLKVYELAGAASSSAFDSGSNGSGSSSANTISFTTGTDHCAAFAVGAHYPSGATADSGYTNAFTEAPISSVYHYGEHNADVGTAGSITLTFGLGSELAWAMAGASYKVAAAGDTLMGQACL